MRGYPEHPRSSLVGSHDRGRESRPVYGAGHKKVPLTISGLKKWVPDGAFGHELSCPKQVSWLPAYETM